jgi:hypothetical protein
MQVGEFGQGANLTVREVRKAVPIGAPGSSAEFHQPFLVDHQKSVCRGGYHAPRGLYRERMAAGSHRLKSSTRAYIEVGGCANPEPAGGILDHSRDRGVLEAASVAKALEVHAIVPEQAIIGTDPEIAFVILQQTVDGQIGQAIALPVLSKGKFLRGRGERHE